MINHMLVSIGLWLARLGGWTAPSPCTRIHLYNRYVDDAARLAGEAEINLPNAGGEAKRHQVYAQLMKLHPDASHKDLALAIEMALH